MKKLLTLMLVSGLCLLAVAQPQSAVSDWQLYEVSGHGIFGGLSGKLIPVSMRSRRGPHQAVISRYEADDGQTRFVTGRWRRISGFGPKFVDNTLEDQKILQATIVHSFRFVGEGTGRIKIGNQTWSASQARDWVTVSSRPMRIRPEGKATLHSTGPEPIQMRNDGWAWNVRHPDIDNCEGEGVMFEWRIEFKNLTFLPLD